MKQCSCGETRLSEFVKNAGKKDGLSSQCRACKAPSQTKWYQRHAAEHKKKVADRNRRIRQELIEKTFQYLLDHPCLDCGETNPIKLDFDHRAGVEKRGNIGRLLTTCHSWTLLKEEIDKCDIRCANCHRVKTAVNGNWLMLKLWREFTEGKA